MSRHRSVLFRVVSYVFRSVSAVSQLCLSSVSTQTVGVSPALSAVFVDISPYVRHVVSPPGSDPAGRHFLSGRGGLLHGTAAEPAERGQ